MVTSSVANNTGTAAIIVATLGGLEVRAPSKAVWSRCYTPLTHQFKNTKATNGHRVEAAFKAHPPASFL